MTADGGVRIVTLNRPEAMNAADDDLHTAIADIWGRLATDDEAAAVVLTGAGRAFSAGGDFDSMVATQQDADRQDRIFSEARRMVAGMIDLPMPLIAAVNGPAVGLGAALVALSDIAIMSERAFIADPHIAVGLVAGDGAAMTWPLLTSLMRAKEYAFTGDRIPADLALQFGLVNRVVAADAVLPESLALAHRLAAMPRRAMQDTKRLLNMHLSRALQGLLDFGISAERQSVTSREHIDIVENLRAAARRARE